MKQLLKLPPLAEGLIPKNNLHLWCLGWDDYAEAFESLSSWKKQQDVRSLTVFVTNSKGRPLEPSHQGEMQGTTVHSSPLRWTSPLQGQKVDLIVFGSLSIPFDEDDFVFVVANALKPNGLLCLAADEIKSSRDSFLIPTGLPRTYQLSSKYAQQLPEEVLRKENEELKQVVADLEMLNNTLSETSEQLSTVQHDQLKQIQQLRKTMGRLRDMVFSTPDWIWEVDENGILTFVSGRVKEMLGYEQKELVGKRMVDLMDLGKGEKLSQLIQTLFNEQVEFHNIEAFFLNKEDDRLCLLSSGVPFFDNAGKLKGFRGSSRDITYNKKYQEELARKTDHFSLALDVAGMGNWQYDTKEEKFLIGEKVYELYGEKPSLSTSPSFEAWKRYLHPEDQERVITQLTDAIANRKSYSLEYRIILQDGRQRWHRSVGEFSQSNSPSTDRLIGVFSDITDQKVREKELGDSKKFIESIAAAIPGIITVYDLEKHKFEFVNDAVDRILGHSRSQLLQEGMRYISPLIHPEDYQRIANTYQARVRDAESYSVSFRIRREDGQFIWVRSYGVVFEKDKDGQVKQLLNITIDIHQGKLTEQRLIENEGKYRELVEYAPMGLIVHNRSGVVFANSTAMRLLKCSRLSDLLGKKLFDFIDPENHPKAQERMNSLFSGASPSIDEERFLAMDGSKLDVEVLGTPVIFNGSSCIQTIFYDVSEKKKTENALRESERLLESINQNIKEAIYRSKLDGTILYANRAFLEMFGIDQDADIGSLKTKMVYANTTDRAKLILELEKEGVVKNKEFLFKRSDGTRFWGAVSSSYIKVKNGETYLDGAIRDITNQKEAEEKLRHSEKRSRMLMENANDAIILADPETGMLLDANKVALGILGRTLEEVKGMHHTELHPRREKEKYEVLFREGANDSSEAVGGSYLILVNRKGDEIPVDIRSSLIDIDGRKVRMGIFRDMTERNDFELELTRLNSELLERNTELMIQEEELASSNAALKKNKKEMEKVLKELSDRNFELDQLVYKTSHDIRSPLTSILGLINIYNLEKDIEKKEESISLIQGRVLKLDEFVKSMLNYAKSNRTPLKPEIVDFESIIKICLADLELLSNYHKMDVQTDITGISNVFFSDTLRLKEIFGNIISNSFKYMRVKEEVEPFLKITVELSKVGAQITFADNGIGIERKYLNRIFDMFFRASERSDGSGLGMYIVKQTVDMLKGNIYIESEVNEGTTIHIDLPSF